jgi:lipoprotein-anchoring transpeptidase ErfK/SrfK
MADVVGSDEGAEAAGTDPEQAGQSDGAATARAGDGDGAEVEAGDAGSESGGGESGGGDTPANEAGDGAETDGAEAGTEAGSDADGDPEGDEEAGSDEVAAAEPSAEAALDEGSQDAGSAIPDGDDAAEETGAAEEQAAETGESAESEVTAEVVTEVEAEVVAEVEAEVVTEVAVEAVTVVEVTEVEAEVPPAPAEEVVAVEAVEAVEETAAVAVVDESVASVVAVASAAPAPAPAPAPVPTPVRSGDAAGRPLPLGLDRRKALLVGGAVVVVGGVVAAFAASGGGSSSTASGKTGAGSLGGKPASPSAAPVPAARISTVPADGATGVDPSKAITVQVNGGTIDSVTLSGQDQTNGTLSTDRSSWTSANVLSVDSHYELTVTAKNSAGKNTTSTVSFRTLSPSATFGVSEVVPPRGSTVGVGQPIRVTFSNYVPAEYKASLEKACVVNTSPPVAGAWYWVSNSTDGAVVDWRPETFWPVNTKVTVNFSLNGVRLGEHQFGVEDYKPHEFTISDRDLRLIVDKDEFRATCYENGKVIKTFPIDTGMTTEETFVTYTGTMSVLGKGNPVEMKGNYGPGDTYDDFVNWATQITWSGTYVHAAEWDTEIGHANDDSHGCVHCRAEDAEWFYNRVISGDVVTINGKRTRPVAVGNGICTFTLDWKSVLKGSAYGPTLNGKPVSA